MRRSFFVFFSYAPKALLKIFWKLVEEVVVEETLDIVVSKNLVAGRWCGGGGGFLVQASSVVTPYSALHAHSAC